MGRFAAGMICVAGFFGIASLAVCEQNVPIGVVLCVGSLYTSWWIYTKFNGWLTTQIVIDPAGDLLVERKLSGKLQRQVALSQIQEIRTTRQTDYVESAKTYESSWTVALLGLQFGVVEFRFGEQAKKDQFEFTVGKACGLR